MIYIITAIYAEAHALINHFQLKKDLSHTRFQVFRDKEAKLCLVISGTGLIPASVAVSSICTEYGAGQQDFLFNVGACAGIGNANIPETGKDCQTGAIFLCNKITEQITGKTFYPDILYQHGFAEAPIITGAKPYMKTPGTQGIAPGERKEPDFSLYDMEASAIYQAGSYFFGPHQMYFLKIVSDDGEIQNVTSKQIQDLIDKKIESIAEYIISLQAMTSKEQTEDSYKQDTMQKSFQSLCFDLHASKAMSESVRQYIRYCVLSGIDYDSVIKEMYLEGKFPCKDKREGKQRFEELKKDYYNPFFSHIYVEKAVLDHPRTKRILQKFPKANLISINHYKDVFCRKGQNFICQQQSQNLILGAKQGTLIYKGAPVCQSFGNEEFYYTSCIMNCIYDCEYCYLKGMYPSGNIVIFVNLEEIFDQVRTHLNDHDMYLCVSYDTDMLAMEPIAGYVEEWISFAKTLSHLPKRLKVEIRTKSANRQFWQKHIPVPGIIYGITLSPQAVIDAYEHKTPSLAQRIASVKEALQRGFSIRLCFDPMLYCRDWQQRYHEMLNQIFAEINMEEIEDVSVGSFRVSQDYLKKMRKNQPDSAVVQFPYQNDNGVYHYPKDLAEQMEGYLVNRLISKLPEDKIFLWENKESKKRNYFKDE